MKTNIHFNMHIAWYESFIINETFDSIKHALDYFNDIDLTINLCLNSQTTFMSPIKGKPEEMFDDFKNHEIYKMSKIVTKTDADNFFNVADWRRDYYNKDGFTIWGESDCLLPQEIFYMIDYINKEIKEEPPYCLVFAHKKMFDDTWKCTEHPFLSEGNLDYWHKKDMKLCCDGYICQTDLDEFNSKIETSIYKQNAYKSEGALTTLSRGFPTPYISPDINVWGDDECFMRFCQLCRIPQYFVTLMKGHNIRHPKKKMNCIDKLDKEKMLTYKAESYQKVFKFLGEVGHNILDNKHFLRK